MPRVQSPACPRHFTPFAFEAMASALLVRTVRDAYVGISSDGALAGFLLLRGRDEGYGVPAYTDIRACTRTRQLVKYLEPSRWMKHEDQIDYLTQRIGDGPAPLTIEEAADLRALIANE